MSSQKNVANDKVSFPSNFFRLFFLNLCSKFFITPGQLQTQCKLSLAAESLAQIFQTKNLSRTLLEIYKSLAYLVSWVISFLIEAIELNKQSEKLEP